MDNVAIKPYSTLHLSYQILLNSYFLFITVIFCNGQRGQKYPPYFSMKISDICCQFHHGNHIPAGVTTKTVFWDSQKEKKANPRQTSATGMQSQRQGLQHVLLREASSWDGDSLEEQYVVSIAAPPESTLIRNLKGGHVTWLCVCVCVWVQIGEGCLTNSRSLCTWSWHSTC